MVVLGGFWTKSLMSNQHTPASKYGGHRVLVLVLPFSKKDQRGRFLDLRENLNSKALKLLWAFEPPKRLQSERLCGHNVATFFLTRFHKSTNCQWRTETSIACAFSKSWRSHATSLTCFLLEEKNMSCFLLRRKTCHAKEIKHEK